MSNPTYITRDGMRIIASQYVCDDTRVKRSWKERLFERPWRPLERWKMVRRPTVIAFIPGVYLVSYETYSKIVEKEANKNWHEDWT